MGATDWEQIYVNAAGPFGQPDASESAHQVRDVFYRMGMNDLETIVLQVLSILHKTRWDAFDC